LRRATDVERAHGELGTGFTDRLSRNDADGFTDIHRGTASQVATIAGGAAALAHLADQRRANADRLDAGLLDDVDMTLLEQGALGSDQVASDRVEHVIGSGTAKDALAERGHDLAGVD